MYLKSVISLSVLLFTVLESAANVLDVKFLLPSEVVVQGRLTLEDLRGGNSNRYQLSFSETIDQTSKRYKLSIGQASQPHVVYYAHNHKPVIKAQNQECESVQHPSSLVPELSWFTDIIFAGVDIKSLLSKNPYLVGPSGLLAVLSELAKDTEYSFADYTSHRGLKVEIWTRTIDLDDCSLRVDILKPTNQVSSEPGTEANSFTVTVSTLNPIRSREDKSNSSNNKQHCKTDELIFTIDIFEQEILASDELNHLRLDTEFTLPLASGCSEFKDKMDLKISAHSFSMSLRQISLDRDIFMAFDQFRGYLRREFLGHSVSIWDIGENMLYHMDDNVRTAIVKQPGTHNKMRFKNCVALGVANQHLSPAFRPFKANGLPMNAPEMLGASKLAYMGLGKIRGLACNIYETVLDQPPLIFATSETFSGPEHRVTNPNRKFLVQFYLVQGRLNKFGEDPEVSEDQFWPIQVNLYKLDKNSPQAGFRYLDSIEIGEFHWTLDGWEQKRRELFMASDCFDDDSEQRQLSLSMKFPAVHDGPMGSDQDMVTLLDNLYKLEYDLTDSICVHLDINRMHLIDYILKLGPRKVDLNMVIGERGKDQSFGFWGQGYVGDESCNKGLRLSKTNEEECIPTASLIEDTHLIVFCPEYVSENGKLEASKCIAYTIDHPPDISNSTSSIGPPCQVYVLWQMPGPAKKATGGLDAKIATLKDFKFEFEAIYKEGKQTFTGHVEQYELSHKLSLWDFPGHQFKLEETSNSLVRAIDIQATLGQNDQSDCAKLCDLDQDCRSYSFCTKPTPEDPKSCRLSALYVHDKSINWDQLDETKLEGDETVSMVRDTTHSPAVSYTLQARADCTIFQKNYLNMFSQSHEIIRISQKLTRQLPKAPSTYGCAEMATESSERPSSMFAFCSQTSTCLLDEGLFSPTANYSADEAVTGDVLCSLYRRQYQSYFHVSVPVFKKNSKQHFELEFKSVEECAHACWLEFGQTCASFDYCQSSEQFTGRCAISEVSNREQSPEHQMESRKDCLHYERDQQLDALHREAIINKRNLLLNDNDPARGKSSMALTSVFYLSLVGTFLIGLYTSNLINERLERVTIERQSISGGKSGIRFSQAFNFFGGRVRLSNAGREDNGEQIETTHRHSEDLDDVIEDSEDIRMEVIPSHH